MADIIRCRWGVSVVNMQNVLLLTILTLPSRTVFITCIITFLFPVVFFSLPNSLCCVSHYVLCFTYTTIVHNAFLTFDV